MSYKCTNCPKEFKYKTTLIEHNNKKISCITIRKNLKCNKCQKMFQYESRLIEHEKRKIPCNKIKENLRCDLCNIDFVRPGHKLIHENTKNHIDKYNKLNNHKLLDNTIIYNYQYEYIYIIHCAQYINTNIYKIGRTTSIINRMKDYPIGSKLILTINCNNSILMKKKIINYLKNTDGYCHCKNIGNTYFKCDLENLKNDIQTIISDNN